MIEYTGYKLVPGPSNRPPLELVLIGSTTNVDFAIAYVQSHPELTGFVVAMDGVNMVGIYQFSDGNFTRVPGS